ncbi:hypothetical protein ACWDSJ_13140 [Nocardia sp. NPDC003482]
MATGVGLRIAEDECIAAILTSGTEDAPEPVYIVREPVLHMSDDGDAALGGEPPVGHSHSITGFFAAVGDPAGIPVDDGEAYRAEDLVATALFCLINLAADHLEGPAEFYATHPSDWPEQQVAALRDALDYLGLRAVVLVSEADLPETDGGGRAYARDAARAALAAVLATPAGTTPPDPTHAENALDVTDILPALQTPQPVAQAYSAAFPAAESVETTAAEQPPTTAEPPASRQRRRIPLLIAAAALVGLMLGGLVVALLLRDHDAPASPLPDARSSISTTTPPPPPPAPTPEPVTEIPEPAPIETPEVTETTPPPPPPTTTPPPTSAPSSTTTPARPTRTTPRRSTPTVPNPWDPIPGLPLPPALEVPNP